jgi:hypothetical protein
LKKRFVEEGFEAALIRNPREKPPRGVLFDGAFEARLIALACSEARWDIIVGRFDYWPTKRLNLIWRRQFPT